MRDRCRVSGNFAVQHLRLGVQGGMVCATVEHGSWHTGAERVLSLPHLLRNWALRLWLKGTWHVVVAERIRALLWLDGTWHTVAEVVRALLWWLKKLL